MKISNILGTLFAVFCIQFYAHSQNVYLSSPGPIFDPYSDAYLYVVSLGNWNQAEASAQSLGGNLITIHSLAENQFVVDNVLQDFSSSGGPNLSNLPLWIGLYDPTGAVNDDGGSQHAQNFVWVDGSNSSYRNWNTDTSEPNDANPGEYYAAINWQFAGGLAPSSMGTWNDTPLAGTLGYTGNTDGPYYGIAAVPVPEPSYWGLIASSLLALFSFKNMRQLSVSLAARS